MKSVFTKLIASLLIAAVVGLKLPVTVFAADPVLSVQLLTATVDGSSYTYSENKTSTPGQAVFLYAEVRNLTAGTVAHNTNFKLNLADSFGVDVHPSLTVTSSDAGSVSDDATLNLTSAGRLRLQYVELTWDADGDGAKEWNSSRLLSAQTQAFTNEGVDFGDLNGGDTYLIQMLFNTSVEAQPAASTSSTWSGGAVSAPTCQDSKPAKATLVSVTRISPSTAKLTWTKSSDADNYSINFGDKSRSYQFGADKTGNVSEYTVNFLNPAVKYYFSVLPTRGCMPGDWSNELSLDPAATLVLAAAQTVQTSDVQSGSSQKISISPTPSLTQASVSATPSATPTVTTTVARSEITLLAGALAIFAGLAIIFQPLLKGQKLLPPEEVVRKATRGRPRKR